MLGKEALERIAATVAPLGSAVSAPGHAGDIVHFRMARTAAGWAAAAAAAERRGEFTPLVSSGLPEAVCRTAEDMALAAAVLAEDEIRREPDACYHNGDGGFDLDIYVEPLGLKGISLAPPQAYEEPAAGKKDPNARWALEREMAHEGIFIQPDGSLCIMHHDDFTRLSPEMAFEKAQRRASEAREREESVRKSGAGRRQEAFAALAARRARHVARLLWEYGRSLGPSPGPGVRTAAQGPFANTPEDDLRERITVIKPGDDEFLDDRNRDRDNERLHPEYVKDKTTTPADQASGYGVYSRWEDLQLDGWLWSKRGTDSNNPKGMYYEEDDRKFTSPL